MAQYPLAAVRGSAHRRLAGRVAQNVAPADAANAVTADLSVLADQAAQYSANAAAGAANAAKNTQATTERLAADRKQTDESIVEMLDNQRAKAKAIEEERQAQRERAMQQIAAVQQRAAQSVAEDNQRASLSVAETQARAANAAAERAAKAAEQKRAQEIEKLAASRTEALMDTRSRYTGDTFEYFSQLVETAPDLATARKHLSADIRSGAGVGTEPGMVSKYVIEEELRRFYNGRR